MHVYCEPLCAILPRVEVQKVLFGRHGHQIYAGLRAVIESRGALRCIVVVTVTSRMSKNESIPQIGSGWWCHVASCVCFVFLSTLNNQHFKVENVTSNWIILWLYCVAMHLYSDKQ